MSAHTPGPWVCERANVRAISTKAMLSGSHERRIALARNHFDAPIIAAAPELLAALKALLADYDEEEQAILCWPDPGCFDCTAGTVPRDREVGPCPLHAAMAAVRKAEGKS